MAQLGLAAVRNATREPPLRWAVADPVASAIHPSHTQSCSHQGTRPADRRVASSPFLAHPKSLRLASRPCTGLADSFWNALPDRKRRHVRKVANYIDDEVLPRFWIAVCDARAIVARATLVCN